MSVNKLVLFGWQWECSIGLCKNLVLFINVVAKAFELLVLVFCFVGKKKKKKLGSLINMERIDKQIRWKHQELYEL